MKSVFCIAACIVIATTLTTTSVARPKKEKQPQQSTHHVLVNQKESDDESQQDMLLSDQPYRPNPVVMAGVGAIMNGALQIAQDPHNRPNLGHSIASMVHGIITIVIEKIAKRNVDINDPQAVEECLRELSLDLEEEIIELIITKKLLP